MSIREELRPHRTITGAGRSALPMKKLIKGDMYMINLHRGGESG
jgi:hypothetical protein